MIRIAIIGPRCDTYLLVSRLQKNQNIKKNPDSCQSRSRQIDSAFTRQKIRIHLYAYICVSCDISLLVESNYELMTREPQKNCKKAFYDIFLL